MTLSEKLRNDGLTKTELLAAINALPDHTVFIVSRNMLVVQLPSSPAARDLGLPYTMHTIDDAVRLIKDGK